jgi:methylaspartate ammonia-lyase
MTNITGIIMAPALGAFFYDDQAAIRRGVEHDGFAYVGEPETAGFDHVRIPAAALSIGLILDTGEVAWGDMVSVQYSGAAGRDPLFEQNRIADSVRDRLAPKLIGRDACDALANCDAAFAEELQLPLAVKYGASQALLSASAQAHKLTMAEVVAQVFELDAPTERIPLFAQSGDDRRLNVDKMLMKRVDVLPHGLINSREKFGPDGATFLDYAKWVAARAQDLGDPEYSPVLHFDMYGWVGLGYSKEPAKVAEFIARTADAVPDHQLHIEAPADYGSKAAQLDNYAAIVSELEKLGSGAKVVADEHCNTLADIRDFCDAKAAHLVQIKTPDVGSLFDTARAIAYAKTAGIGAYCGGTSAETDLSARACVHVALAMRADMMLAKPGMGVDEGICIVGNEQSRTLAQIRQRLGMEALI